MCKVLPHIFFSGTVHTATKYSSVAKLRSQIIMLGQGALCIVVEEVAIEARLDQSADPPDDVHIVLLGVHSCIRERQVPQHHIGALIIRMWFWGRLYYTDNKGTPQNPILNYYGPYINASRDRMFRLAQ